jgi:hypothetical protein
LGTAFRKFPQVAQISVYRSLPVKTAGYAEAYPAVFCYSPEIRGRFFSYSEPEPRQNDQTGNGKREKLPVVFFLDLTDTTVILSRRFYETFCFRVIHLQYGYV